MNRVLAVAAALVVEIGIESSHAGAVCCPASRAKAAECGEACLEKSFKSIEMTKQQQQKVAALMDDCKGKKCSISSAKAMKKGLKEILTAEQIKTLKASCKQKKCFLRKLDAEIES